MCVLQNNLSACVEFLEETCTFLVSFPKISVQITENDPEAPSWVGILQLLFSDVFGPSVAVSRDSLLESFMCRGGGPRLLIM